MYLLDANVLMHIANRATGYESIRDKLKTLRKSDFALSAITAIELWQMTYNNTASKRGRAELSAMFHSVRVIPFNADASEYGGLLLTVTKEKGKAIGWPDTMLAAHALTLNATVVTNNTRHFVRSGCKLEDWRGFIPA